MEQVHPRRADRKLLFPQRDVAFRFGRGQDDDERGGLMRELLERLDLDALRLGPLGAIGPGDQRRERVALIASDDGEAPRRELAVIGGARGDLKDARELRVIGGRARPDRAACPSGGWRGAKAGCRGC